MSERNPTSREPMHPLLWCVLASMIGWAVLLSKFV